ncbi:hypothetical protein [Serratia liquefaciens]|uniref:hypothetical protein n=1 Tax=Serratia liquefaciens TaxID=614 RepID=UPI0003585477|nr:hypothetical protein [Serratia liquefaciens]AGQ30540.1 hypothetical protein M495_08780 [Serratia liquefaciens ATCC 27592]CAI0883838.1 Uncharacterised protein [Serratia liquefaciens]
MGAKKFKNGDIVRAKGIGPRLRVLRYRETQLPFGPFYDVICEFIEGPVGDSRAFPEASLYKDDENTRRETGR